MKTTERLERWRNAGLITNAQYGALKTIVLKERFSVFLELNALLYVGVISLVGGLAWSAGAYSERIGDSFLVIILSGLFALCLWYCFSRSHAYSTAEVESPNLAFDYVLYAGCLIFSLDLGYIENRFQLLQSAWDSYLLLGAAIFFVLSYRFDNRLVLLLGLSSLAGWFGLRFSKFGLLTEDSIRVYALAYGTLVAAAGSWLWRRTIKKHFLDMYLHLAANVVFVALLTGVDSNASGWVCLAGLLLLCGVAGWMGITFRRFAFVAYAVVYGYSGISYQVISELGDFVPSLAYLMITGIMVVIWMARLARQLTTEK